MNLSHAQRLAPFFGVSIDFILGGDAINPARTLNDLLETLFTEMFEEFVEKTDPALLDTRSRLVYELIDRLLHDHVTECDLRIMLGLLDLLDKHREPRDPQ